MMKKLTILMLSFAMTLVVSKNSWSSEVYSEEFNTDPGFVFAYTPKDGERFTWNSTEGIYEIVMKDQSALTYKYALTTAFTRVENTSFVVQMDIKPVFLSFGHGMQILFYDTAVGYDEASINIMIGGSHDPTFRFRAFGMEEQRTANVTMGLWYRVKFAYDETSGTVNILVTNRATGGTFYEKENIPCSPASFDRGALGVIALFADGTSSETHYDNISVSYGQANDGLVAWYKLDGNAKDSSRNGNDGTAFGGVTYTKGVFGQAASFDGIDDFIEIDSVASEISNIGTGTISLWFKSNSNDSAPLINFDANSSENTGYFALGTFSSGLAQGSIGYSVCSEAPCELIMAYQQGNNYYFDDIWHHALVTIGQSSNAIYVDGKKLMPLDYQEGDISAGNCMWVDVSQVTIGKRLTLQYWPYSSFIFKGAIDDVRIYNRALTEAEVGELYKSQTLCTEQPEILEKFDNGEAIWPTSQQGVFGGPANYSEWNIDLHWSYQRGDIRAEVLNDALRIYRTGSSGSHSCTFITQDVDIPIDDDTRVQFDVMAEYSNVRGGAGDGGTELPAWIMLRLESPEGYKILGFGYNYRGGSNKSGTWSDGGEYVYYINGSVTQNAWLLGENFTIRDTFPAAERITNIRIGGNGWDFISRFDNFQITTCSSQAQNEPPQLSLTSTGTECGGPIDIIGQVSDADGDNIDYTWLVDGTIYCDGTIQTQAGVDPIPLPECVSWSEILSETREYTVTLQVADGINDLVSRDIVVEIVDTTPPSIKDPADVTAEQTSADGTEVTLQDPVVSDSCKDNWALSNDAPNVFPLGETTVNWTARDNARNSANATQVVTVVDTTPPQITAPADITVEQASLDGTAVDLGQASAKDICDTSPAITNDAPAVFPLGTHTVKWTTTDTSGNSATAVQSVTVQDTTPPTLEVSVSQQTLWPANSKYVTVSITIQASDICDASVADNAALVSITSDEPEDASGVGDGKTKDDIVYINRNTVKLRAERDGTGDGRVYTLNYSVMDESGNTSTASVTVGVPHDKKDVPVDSGVVYTVIP